MTDHFAAIKGSMTAMQLSHRRNWRSGHGWLVALMVAAAMESGLAAEPSQAAAASGDLSGSWTLRESSGNLPEQATQAIDGLRTSTVPSRIEIDQTDALVRVRRISQSPAVLRVMFLGTGEPDARAAEGALLTGRADWRDGALVSQGKLAIKQGFVKRRVTFEEQWRPDAEGSTVTVTITMKTPLGVKTRTQVYVREPKKNLTQQ